MLINKKGLTKKVVTSVILCVLFIGSIVLGLEKMDVINLWTEKPVLTQEEQIDKEINDTAKKRFIEAVESPSNSNTDPERQAADTIELTAKQETNGSVTILTKLFGFSDGKCTLTITNAGETLNHSADIIYQPEFSSCAGFSVPKNSLGKGSWSIQLTVTNSADSSSSKTTTLEVK